MTTGPCHRLRLSWLRRDRVEGKMQNSSYIVCEASFVSDLFVVVRDLLEDLVTRYKHWDDVKTHS